MRGVPQSLVPLLAACGTALTLYAGYFRMFSSFAPWDDEGYMLVALRAFRAGGTLYDEVYSQYGPLYFLLNDLLFGALGLPVTHDAGRLVTLGLWTATSLVVGVAVWRLTRSAGLGLCAQLVAFRSLFVFSFEPMHPGGWLCLLLAALVVVPLVWPARPRLAAMLLGLLVAALALIKINLGVFAGIAAAFFYAASIPQLARRRALLGAAGLALAAAPGVLMAPGLGQSWVRSYALHVTVAAVAAALAVGCSMPQERLGPRPVRWSLAAAFGAGLLVSAVMILRGTTPAALFDAVLLRPLGQPSIHVRSPYFPEHSGTGALLALGLCVAAVARRRVKRGAAGAAAGAGLFRIAAGLRMAGSVSGLFLAPSLGLLTAVLVWITALEPEGLESPPALAIARRLLPPFIALQTLHAYPVAGSQVQWAAFLLVPGAAICVADGARQLGRAARALGWPVLGWRSRVVGATCVLLLLALVLLGIWIPLLHESHVALGLPGAARLRLPAAQVEELRATAEALRAGCDTYVSLPGLNSFYFWTGQEPPSAANTTNWMHLFETSLQARVVSRLERIDRLCALYAPAQVEAWAQGRPLPSGPLLAYIMREFRPAGEHGAYRILVRRSAP
jgi:hypothetical protein